MAEKQTILTLLQVIGLTLPAAGIYLRMLDETFQGENMGHPHQATVHQIRLTFIGLVLSGLLLLLDLLIIEHGTILWVIFREFTFIVPPRDWVVTSFFILAIFSLAFALLMFGLSVSYWPDALQLPTSIIWGIENPISRIFWDNQRYNRRLLRRLKDDGSLTKDELIDELRIAPGIRDKNYVSLLLEYSEENEYIDEEDGVYQITEKGEGELEDEDGRSRGPGAA